MKKLLFVLLFFVSGQGWSQLYFPPATGTWQTADPASLGWCQDSIDKLYNYLEARNTDAFIVLKDGKIVLEKYFGTFTENTPHVWNSAGKTLTAFAVGIAQSEGYLSISDTTSNILGYGWTSLTPTQEEKITVRHQLTMTTGLNDGGDNNCTDPSCLTYLADPGTRWAYHTAAYTLLDSVMQMSTGQTLNAWVNQKIKTPTGMTGAFYTSNYDHVFVSNARSMARFGLLLLANGVWDGTDLLNDPTYFYDMTHSSQTLNKSYGYLTWLNGQQSFMIPQSQLVFNGPALPDCPMDAFCALGKNAQFINVLPNENIVLVRMGDASGTNLVEITFNDTIWQYMNHLGCALGLQETSQLDLQISPNPSSQGIFSVDGLTGDAEIRVIDQLGKTVEFRLSESELIISNATPGIYLLLVTDNNKSCVRKLVIE